MASPLPPGAARFAGIVVAAGQSERFGGPVPKQFERIGGRTLLDRAVQCLADCPAVREVVAVLAPEEIGGPREAALRAGAPSVAVTAGGATRAASVRHGLARAAGAEFVLVHDAARPFASAELVERVVRETIVHGAAVPVVTVPDTVRTDDGSGFAAGTIDREALRLAQTPQGARVDWLVEALEAAERDGAHVTDEGAALERVGRRVRLVAGDPGNVKITTAGDLSRARRMEEGEGGMRVGIGFDIHRFGGDGPLVLGGIRFDGEPGLLGHSDADVVLHAAMDAVLGAAALGDIGAHFPPSDPAWRGASSADLARRVAQLLSDEGYVVSNLDVALLAERPRVRERVERMRAAIAESFGIPPGRVGVQATTLESLGALGRGEGIACQAVALVRRRDAAS